MMAETEQLPIARRRHIAMLVGQRLVSLRSLFALESAPKLAESLPIWIWQHEPSADEVTLREATGRTNRWHHQIQSSLGPTMFARTIEGGDTDSALLLQRSDLATKIDQAITWADENVEEAHWDASLLFVPRLMLHALWFRSRDEDRLYVIDAPRGGFAEKTEISAAELTGAISRLSRDEWERTDAPARGSWPSDV